ncbi:MAG: cytochrome c [Rhodospirillaceae bacterium]|nr:cytochrome c [Rhodospirillaceae bacterium]
MKKTISTIILAGALLSGVLGFGANANAADADKLFDFYCAQCHGSNGDGKGPNVTETFPVTPRAFNNAAEMNKLTDADLRNVIREGGPIGGKSEMMPPWGKSLNDEEIEALVVKIRALCQCKGKQG